VNVSQKEIKGKKDAPARDPRNDTEDQVESQQKTDLRITKVFMASKVMDEGDQHDRRHTIHHKDGTKPFCPIIKLFLGEFLCGDIQQGLVVGCVHQFEGENVEDKQNDNVECQKSREK